GQEGWPRRFPIAQLPNPPLIAAGVGWGLASFTEGSSHDVGRAVFTVGFAVWGVEEAVVGANWFRRLMGAGALVWLAASTAGTL
ncbi:MAG TPA: hypothetical protein VIJ20_00625, partial [Solirubrobacteraceae bacterium]